MWALLGAAALAAPLDGTPVKVFGSPDPDVNTAAIQVFLFNGIPVFLGDIYFEDRAPVPDPPWATLNARRFFNNTLSPTLLVSDRLSVAPPCTSSAGYLIAEAENPRSATFTVLASRTDPACGVLLEEITVASDVSAVVSRSDFDTRPEKGHRVLLWDAVNGLFHATFTEHSPVGDDTYTNDRIDAPNAWSLHSSLVSGQEDHANVVELAGSPRRRAFVYHSETDGIVFYQEEGAPWVQPFGAIALSNVDSPNWPDIARLGNTLHVVWHTRVGQETWYATCDATVPASCADPAGWSAPALIGEGTHAQVNVDPDGRVFVYAEKANDEPVLYVKCLNSPTFAPFSVAPSSPRERYIAYRQIEPIPSFDLEAPGALYPEGRVHVGYVERAPSGQRNGYWNTGNIALMCPGG